MSTSELRDKRELQRAHDLLVAIVLQEVDFGLDERRMELIRMAAAVLCWALRHEHNQKFNELLALLEEAAAKKGLRLVDTSN